MLFLGMPSGMEGLKSQTFASHVERMEKYTVIIMTTLCRLMLSGFAQNATERNTSKINPDPQP